MSKTWFMVKVMQFDGLLLFFKNLELWKMHHTMHGPACPSSQTVNHAGPWSPPIFSVVLQDYRVSIHVVKRAKLFAILTICIHLSLKHLLTSLVSFEKTCGITYLRYHFRWPQVRLVNGNSGEPFGFILKGTSLPSFQFRSNFFNKNLKTK